MNSSASERCERRLNSLFRQLKASTESLKEKLTSSTDRVLIRKEHSLWQNEFEEYLNCHDEYCKTLDDAAIAAYNEQYFTERSEYIETFKHSVNEWFSVNKTPVPSLRTSSSRTSTLSSARIKEAQRLAELEARAETQKEKEVLDMAAIKVKHQQKQLELEKEKEKEALDVAAIKVKHQQEQLELETEIKVSRKKVKVLEELGSQRGLNSISNSDNNDFISVHSEIVNDVNIANSGVANPPVVSQPFVNTSLVSNSIVNPPLVSDSVVNTPIVSNSIVNMPVVSNSSVDPPIVSNSIANSKVNPTVVNQPVVSINMPLVNHSAYNPVNVSPKVNPVNSLDVNPNVYAQGSLGNVNNEMSIIKYLKKPPLEVQVFGGDVLKYPRFKRQLNSILIHCDDYDEKFGLLEKYTNDEAYNLIVGYSYLDSYQAFHSAMKALDDKYGNNDEIANAFIRRALNWPVVNKPKALEQFSVFLVECENAIRSVDGVKVLEYPDNIQKILKKLPYSIQEKWRNIVFNTRSDGLSPKFSQLVQLVKCESKKMNDPTYGKDALFVSPGSGIKPSNSYSHNRPRANFSNKVSDQPPIHRSDAAYDRNRSSVGRGRTPFRSFGNNTNRERKRSHEPQIRNALPKPCIFCKRENHSIEKCTKFEELDYQDKQEFVERNRICYGCLKVGHYKKYCQQNEFCKKCDGLHPTVMHMNDRNKGNKTDQAVAESVSTVGGVGAHVTSSTEAGECTMAIVPVRVKMKNSTQSIITYAFHDPGSSICFCTTSIMNRLGCYGKRRRITLETMGKTQNLYTYRIEGMQICSLDSDDTIDLPSTYTKEKMPVSHHHIPRQDDINKWPHLDGIQLPNLGCEIGLLIGNNVADAYRPLEVKTGPRNSPNAFRSMLGWLIWNLVRDKSSRYNPTVNHAEVLLEEKIVQQNQLETLFRQSVNLDFPERIIDDKRENSQNDKLFIKKVEDSIKFKDGHYWINLPFKTQNTVMPNNITQAEGRLKSLQRKMESDPQLESEYKEYMTKVLEQGYAERVPDDEINRTDGKVYYLPHHAVYHPRKKKIRVVFDCAARYYGVSINDMLLQGPDLTNNLVGVLLRFRQSLTAVIGDINNMFHQILVPKEDRDFLRFLWWPCGDTSKDPVIYRMVVHLFGATSSPSCANSALRKTALDNHSNFEEIAVQTVLNNFYVDDCLKSVDSESDMINLVEQLCILCKRGGFILSKWISSSRKVIDSIPESERAKEVKDLDLDRDSLPLERALGVSWSVENDAIEFHIQLQRQSATRRGILSVVSSVYDPLGLASPFILPAKLLLQNLCRQRLGWDDTISEQDLKTWNNWLDNLPKLEALSVPRCYKPDHFQSIVSCEIHSFSDSSEYAYGVVIYIRLEDSIGNIHCSPVIGKSRVAPIKKITIPRMELTAATVSVKLCNMILREIELPVSNVYYWTDSMSVLRYIRNEDARFHTFVANRVTVIRDGSDISQWNYVDTAQNPADDTSRIISFENGQKVQRWFNGPSFLWRPKEEWPKETEIPLSIEDDPEVKIVSAAIVEENPSIVDRLISYFSSWFKLKRVVARLLIGFQNLLYWAKVRKEIRSRLEQDIQDQNLLEIKVAEEINRQKLVQSSENSQGLVTIEDLQRAENSIVRYVQEKHFSEQIDNFQKDTRVILHKSSSLHRLDPILKDGILSVGGRLSKSTLPYESQHPVILPHHSPVSALIISSIHSLVGHLGKSAVLAELRTRYWIIKASSIIKGIISRCVICRKYKAKVSQQKMADLPVERLIADEPVFSRVGMDYFGPIEVKRGRSTVKRWGVIFTCLSVRAVHLEVAYSLDTDSCINALRRFSSRRGPIKYIRSDNGTNFVGSERELREELGKLNAQKIHDSMLQSEINWEFNPPAASHFGGVWERLIRTVRRILYALLKEHLIPLDDEALHTFLCEVEAIMNARPITTVSTDPHDIEALTPNHLLLTRPGEKLPIGVFEKTDKFARRKWRQIQYLSGIFWKRWSKEYLTLLQERQKWLNPQKNVSVGDVVLVLDSNLKGSYALGRVKDVICDKNGLVRVANVKTATSTVTRPIHKLSVILEKEGDSLM